MFFVFGQAIIRGVNQHYYQHIEDLSKNLAKGYADSLTKSIVAEERINSLLEDKLLLASELTGIYGDVETREDVFLLAQTLRVDEINIYDEQGVLLYTTMASVDQWQTYEGHPIYEFIQSEENSFVEETRANVVTGIQYKYGYFKLENGHIIQIGIQADAIINLLLDMNVGTALQQMVKDNNIVVAALFDNEDKYIATTSKDYVGFYLDENEVIFLNNNNGIVGHTSHDNESIYELFVPIIVNDERIGTLAFAHNLNAEQEDILTLIYIGILILIIVGMLIVYVIFSNYDKNKQLAKAAYFDPLTGLPNTEYLQLRFNRLRMNKREKNALMLINVSEFRAINMAYGFEMGNIVLVEMANRLKDIVNDEVKLIRLNSDRFILLIEDYRNNDYLEEIAQGICNKFSDPFEIEDVNRYLHAEIGVVKIEDKSQSIMDIIQKAAIAIELDDSSDACNYSLYDSEVEALIKREELIAIELQEIIEGIDQHRLTLQYQPQFEIETNKVQTLEALARMKSKFYGNVSPDEFIAIAEKNHLIYDLGQLIMRKACQFIKSINNKNESTLRIAINVSGIQLLHDEFVEDVKSIISEFSIEPNRLEIEITESVVMHDIDNTMDVISDLHKLGVTISLDDFGTGHSSFYRLSEFNVDTLKIDRSFVSQITIKPSKKLITKEIIQMAHKFDLLVVAEGVENEDEYNYLKQHNCDLIQGYYLCKPLDENDLNIFLKNQ